MTRSGDARAIHLVGTVPLADAETVFRTLAEAFGDRLRRIPDGETGRRLSYLRWQYPYWARIPEFVPTRIGDARLDPSYAPRLGLRADADPHRIRFESIGYVEEARASYEIFRRMKDDGVIARRTRFQCNIPPPFSQINYFLELDSQLAVEPVYEARVRSEIDAISDAIPNDELALQWDVSVEIAVLEEVSPAPFDNVRDEILERLIRIATWVPEAAEMGFHLCYGDRDHTHFVQPRDLGKLVDVANELARKVARPINFIHMPVPRNRDDESYFAPLGALELKPESELFLGLVHYTDGVEGTERRLRTAERVVSDFGIATECGWGTRPPETIPGLIDIHDKVSVAGTRETRSAAVGGLGS